MSKKKLFVTPKVVQEVQICLEKDLLQGPSVLEKMTTTIQGQEQVIHGVDDVTGESYFEEGDWSN